MTSQNQLNSLQTDRNLERDNLLSALQLGYDSDPRWQAAVLRYLDGFPLTLSPATTTKPQPPHIQEVIT